MAPNSSKILPILAIHGLLELSSWLNLRTTDASGGIACPNVSELKCPANVAAVVTRKAGTHEAPFQARAVLSKPSKSELEVTEKLSPAIDDVSGPGTSPLVAGSTFAQLRADVGVVNAWLQSCETNGPEFPVCIEQTTEVACAGVNVPINTTGKI